jgi:putrescine transport system substrate-binding protein
VDSWDLIFKRTSTSSSSSVAMLNSPDEILPIALRYLGLDE